MLKLIELRPGERWAVDAASIDVDLINDLLERKGQPRVLAAQDSEESAGLRLLELDVDRLDEGSAFCYITVRDSSGEAVAEYRALMAQDRRGWGIGEWITVFEMGSEG